MFLFSFVDEKFGGCNVKYVQAQDLVGLFLYFLDGNLLSNWSLIALLS